MKCYPTLLLIPGFSQKLRWNENYEPGPGLNFFIGIEFVRSQGLLGGPS